MRKFLIALYPLLVLCILLKSTACTFISERRYCILSNSASTVSMVSGTDKNCLSCVLDNNELVLFDYSGQILTQKEFDSKISFMETHKRSILLLFENNTVELYFWNDNELEQVFSKEFSYNVKKTELLEWGADQDGAVILLENGELWRSVDYTRNQELILMEKNIKTAAYNGRGTYLLYIDENGKIKTWCDSSTFHLDLDISSDILEDIIELKVVRVDDEDGYIDFIGIGKQNSYYIKSAEGRLFVNQTPDISVIPLGVTKGMPTAFLYQKNGKIYYEGPSNMKRRDFGATNHYTINVPENTEVFPFVGGIIYYNDKNIDVLLVP